MVSVIIPTRNSAGDLEILLPRLVSSAVGGLVRQVIIADAGSTDSTRLICEDAGADWRPAGLLAATRAAKSPWLLFLPAAFAWTPDLERAVEAHLAKGGGIARLGGDRGWWGRRRNVALLAPARALAGRRETEALEELVRAVGRGAPRL